uniref:Uncharacterized protein n=1 Tax=Leersia perrieri TaxID=77586 RepID=A0A0D9WWR7_9ORYZ
MVHLVEIMPDADDDTQEGGSVSRLRRRRPPIDAIIQKKLRAAITTPPTSPTIEIRPATTPPPYSSTDDLKPYAMASHVIDIDFPSIISKVERSLPSPPTLACFARPLRHVGSRFKMGDLGSPT